MTQLMISIASDHNGYILKDKIITYLKSLDHHVIDIGTNSESSVDYPDYANALCDHIRNELSQFGILICSTGIGMSIAANRHSSARAALVTNLLMAERARMHNDANILVLGSIIADDDTNISFVDKFLTTNFEGGRHLKRILKLS